MNQTDMRGLWFSNRPQLMSPSKTLKARKLEHDHPPTPNQRKGKQPEIMLPPCSKFWESTVSGLECSVLLLVAAMCSWQAMMWPSRSSRNMPGAHVDAAQTAPSHEAPTLNRSRNLRAPCKALYDEFFYHCSNGDGFSTGKKLCGPYALGKNCGCLPELICSDGSQHPHSNSLMGYPQVP